MPIPDYQTIMLPLLRFAADGEEHSMREVIDALAAEFGLTDEERNQLLPSGQRPIFNNRVGWACTYLRKAGLLMSPRRGIIRITERGQQALAQNPEKIDNDFLSQYEEFREFIQLSRSKDPSVTQPESHEVITPLEALERAYASLMENLAEELLQRVKEASPTFFERLVVELLVAMGYGGSRHEAGQAIGRSSDEGIDGIINEDRLGLDVVYIQAKRWSDPVGRPEIQKFVGALQGKRARKGIFITTSSFTKEAMDYASNIIDPKIVLIDGRQLVSLMIEYNVGVSTQSKYEIKGIDRDFFLEE